MIATLRTSNHLEAKILRWLETMYRLGLVGEGAGVNVNKLNAFMRQREMR